LYRLDETWVHYGAAAQIRQLIGRQSATKTPVFGRERDKPCDPADWTLCTGEYV